MRLTLTGGTWPSSWNGTTSKCWPLSAASTSRTPGPRRRCPASGTATAVTSCHRSSFPSPCGSSTHRPGATPSALPRRMTADAVPGGNMGVSFMPATVPPSRSDAIGSTLTRPAPTGARLQPVVRAPRSAPLLTVPPPRRHPSRFQHGPLDGGRVGWRPCAALKLAPHAAYRATSGRSTSEAGQFLSSGQELRIRTRSARHTGQGHHVSGAPDPCP